MGRYPEEKISLVCYARKPGDELKALAPVPCKKEACERYRDKYPHCVMMEILGKNGKVITVDSIREIHGPDK
jgi:hypothetical protein